MQCLKYVESKTSASQIKDIIWNPGMDLYATIFEDGSLICYRLLSLQKVWSNKNVEFVAWRPDGRVLAVGSKQNKLQIMDVEDGGHVMTNSEHVTSIGWFHCREAKYHEDPISIKKSFSHKLTDDQTSLNILLVATDSGLLNFYCLGSFCFGTLRMHPENSNSEIVKIHMSSCMTYVTSVICTKNSNNTSYSLKISSMNIMNKRSNELLRLSKLYTKINEELNFLTDISMQIKTSWEDVLAGLDSKLSSYCSRKNKSPDDSGTGYTFLSADELLQLLVIGLPSDNLEKFLADMSDKGLKKLNNAIEQTCLRVQNLIVEHAQKCCYRLHEDLNLLRGMALWKERYGEIGISDEIIVGAMKGVGSLLLKLTEMQQVLNHSLKSTKSFFRWLISIACRLTGEQNNSVVPNDINKMTQQDIQLITDFIIDNFDYNTCETDMENDSQTNLRPTCSNFTLEQVGQYLKLEPLSRLKYSFAKPNSNFWVEFLMKRPELTESMNDDDGTKLLLFYKHNPTTSMEQEYHAAQMAIKKIFDSISQNIIDKSEEFIDVKDFIKNASSNRIRIETNIKVNEHYTLFQSKANQYLLVQNLQDKSFKLLLIKFQVEAEDLTVSDSNFYDSNLSFLLLDDKDTLIVQIELEKLFENHPIPFRKYKDLAKIFRNEVSMEKNSTQVIYELDIRTEPPQDRKFEPGLMVKKIKNTTGKDLFSSSERGIIAFTSCTNKRLHLYELETNTEVVDDEIEGVERIDESLIDTDIVS